MPTGLPLRCHQHRHAGAHSRTTTRMDDESLNGVMGPPRPPFPAAPAPPD